MRMFGCVYFCMCVISLDFYMCGMQQILGQLLCYINESILFKLCCLPNQCVISDIVICVTSALTFLIRFISNIVEVQAALCWSLF